MPFGGVPREGRRRDGVAFLIPNAILLILSKKSWICGRSMRSLDVFPKSEFRIVTALRNPGLGKLGLKG
jgi:hypothetical protein